MFKYETKSLLEIERCSKYEEHKTHRARKQNEKTFYQSGREDDNALAMP
jgi:hypothetical protein